MIRDVLLNNVPIIFKKEIYAMASIFGGLVYWVLMKLGLDMNITVVMTFVVVCVIRLLAVKYHISLPVLKGED